MKTNVTLNRYRPSVYKLYKLLKIVSISFSSIAYIGFFSMAHAYPDPNKDDHTFNYGNGADLVPAACHTGNHLLWENKKPDKIFDNDAQHDKLVFRKSMEIFKGGDLPAVLRNPPAGGIMLNAKSLGAWELDGDWRTNEQMLIIILGKKDKVLWVSKPTDDLPSSALPSSVINGGSILITEEVTEIRISHVDNRNYGIGVDDYRGSVIPDHVCIEYTAPSTSCGEKLSFTTPKLEGGVKKQVGAIYRFPNVSTGVDALVEILAISNAKIGKIDDTSSGSDAALQVELLMDNSKSGVSVPDQHVDFDIRFVKTNTMIPVFLSKAYATGVDIDSDLKGTREYTVLPHADSYTIENPSNLKSFTAGGFTPIDIKQVSGINLDNTEAMFTAEFNNVSSFRYTTGFKNDGSDYTSWHRQSSLSFECVTYDNPKKPPVIEACFDPILIDDDSNHRIWKITGATKLADLTGKNLNDGTGIDLVEVGKYSLDYNIQGLSYDGNGNVWALAMGKGGSAQSMHAYIGQIVENAGIYSFTNVIDTGHVYKDGDHGKGLAWDSYNKYFIFEANPYVLHSKSVIKAYDPVTKSIVADPWGNGSSELTFDVPGVGDANYMQGLAFSPDGTLYGSVGYSPSILIKFEHNAQHKQTGKITVIGKPGLDKGLDNIEAIDFMSDGTFIIIQSNSGSSSSGHSFAGTILTVNPSTGETSLVANLDNGYAYKRDWEGIKFCNTPFAGNPPPPASVHQCYAMNDDNHSLHRIDLDSSTKIDSIKMDRAFNGEGTAYRASNNSLYAFHQNNEITSSKPSDLYKISLDGKSTLIAKNFIPYRASGAEFVSYSDGTEQFIILMKESSSEIHVFDAKDLASNIPLKTLKLINDSNSNQAEQIDGLAVNPNTGEVLVIRSRKPGKIYPIIYSVNMTTGKLSHLITLKQKVDAESLTFAADGKLYTEGEKTGSHKIFRIDLNTGSVTKVEDDNTLSGDIESLACTGSKIITPKKGISGFVFKDNNSNDVFDNGESGIANISVWLQAVNSDGSIDPTKVLAATDTQGNYQLAGLADGKYQVHVDTSDLDLPSDHILGGSNPLEITINGSSITNADFPFDEVICEALSGETSQIALMAPAQISNKDFVIVPSSSLAPVAGHLRAYKVQDSGLPKTTASWDAGKKMSVSKRKAKFYSTNSEGKKVLFSTLDKEAFGASKEKAKTIKEYTFDPSYQSGEYLSGREDGAYLGGISHHNGIQLLNQEIDTLKYLADTDYQSYYKDIVSLRDKRVLLGSDDGFLYSFDYKKGDLAWAWMPRTLVKELKDYENFQTNSFMRGQIDTFDLNKKRGDYHPYIVGSYKGGLGHYVLKLNKSSSSKSDLKSVVWDSDRSSGFVSSPNNGQMEYFSDDKGKTYAAYVMTNSSNESTLMIRSLVDNKTKLQISLGFNVTSTPFVMVDYKKHNAPARKTIYIGNDKGKIYSASLLESNGELRDENKIKADLKSAAIASLNSSNTDSILFIGASVSSTDHGYYLRAQSETRLSVFKYDTQSGHWKRVWSSYEGGSGEWQSDGTHTSNPSNIQHLPTGATITDNAYIVGDSIVLPVNIPDPTGVMCYGIAYYYLYKLNDGSFPKTRFYKLDDSQISGNIKIGYGKATRLVLSDLPDKDVLVAYGHAEQTTNKETGVNDTFIIRDSMTTGVRSWRILEDLD